MSSLPDYVTVFIGLMPVAYNIWNRPGVMRCRNLRRTSATPPPRCPVPAPPTQPVGILAAELLSSLPPGGVAQYEAPDGSRLTVWRIAGPPPADDGLEEYALW